MIEQQQDKRWRAVGKAGNMQRAICNGQDATGSGAHEAEEGKKGFSSYLVDS